MVASGPRRNGIGQLEQAEREGWAAAIDRSRHLIPSPILILSHDTVGLKRETSYLHREYRLSMEGACDWSRRGGKKCKELDPHRELFVRKR